MSVNLILVFQVDGIKTPNIASLFDKISCEWWPNIDRNHPFSLKLLGQGSEIYLKFLSGFGSIRICYLRNMLSNQMV